VGLNGYDKDSPGEPSLDKHFSKLRRSAFFALFWHPGYTDPGKFGWRGADGDAQAVARGTARCASQVLGRGAEADFRGATQVLDRDGQAVALSSCACLR
jgi:hypothetical protein